MAIEWTQKAKAAMRSKWFEQPFSDDAGLEVSLLAALDAAVEAQEIQKEVCHLRALLREARHYVWGGTLHHMIDAALMGKHTK